MECLFVAERLVVDPSITAIDSTLLKANGHVWHKSSMEKGVVLVLTLIQMQGGDTVIPKDGSLDINYILHRPQVIL